MRFVPNTLSFLRLCLAPVSTWLIVNELWLVAFWVFVVAVATDLIDGPLARKFAAVTESGGLLDHLSDFIFVTSSMVALTALGYLPIALPPIIAAAFLQYLFDSRIGNGGLRGSRLGRWNGIAYFVAVGVPISILGLEISFVPIDVVKYVGWTLVLTTAVSMGERAILLLRYRKNGNG